MGRRTSALALALAVAALLPGGALGTAPGAVKLDNYTLDKVLAIPDFSVLVKFDQSYAYGEQEDEFKVLCRLAYEVPKFLVAEVPIQEYGDKENDDLRERFKIKKEEFPAYFLFRKANPEPLRYAGPVTAEDLSGWLRGKGISLPTIGTIQEMDDLAKKFLKEGQSDAHLAEAKKAAEEKYSTDKKAPMYVKIMQKIKEKGEAYVGGEVKRVQKLLESQLTAEKKSELADKLRILNVFAAKDEL